MDRLAAYAMLAEFALDVLWQSVGDVHFPGCCPECCAACKALRYLDDEGILDAVLENWSEYDDGTKRIKNSTVDLKYNDDGKIDREWVYAAWKSGREVCGLHE